VVIKGKVIGNREESQQSAALQDWKTAVYFRRKDFLLKQRGLIEGRRVVGLQFWDLVFVDV